ncbi:hypothetical protein Glove_71g162 [Diversispora epigaea]|uniref:Uncharacterized protein n=1 Tax=Diversispora epigaea TaxID=1348612 RepID=A0A397JJL5_9GLOM|nr:hypothetical protein Glove_71g162 [Diversispora epigaea]
MSVKELNSPLRESSEECAIQLHHYTPQDEIDKGMFCLFANKKNDDDESDDLVQTNSTNSRISMDLSTG